MFFPLSPFCRVFRFVFCFVFFVSLLLICFQIVTFCSSAFYFLFAFYPSRLSFLHLSSSAFLLPFNVLLLLSLYSFLFDPSHFSLLPFAPSPFTPPPSFTYPHPFSSPSHSSFSPHHLPLPFAPPLTPFFSGVHALGIWGEGKPVW